MKDSELNFLDHGRVARFATVDGNGQPHVVPICYAVADGTAYFTIDEKPKQPIPKSLKRIRNLQENPRVALVVDRYDNDWARLGWVMLQGKGSLLASGEEHTRAQLLLKARYPQLAEMQIDELPVVAIRLNRVISWGNLDTD